MRWQREIEEGSIRRADIARRERLTHARVTQVMSLLDLPDEVKEELLSISEGRPEWSVREALGRVGG